MRANAQMVDYFRHVLMATHLASKRAFLITLQHIHSLLEGLIILTKS